MSTKGSIFPLIWTFGFRLLKQIRQFCYKSIKNGPKQVQTEAWQQKALEKLIWIVKRWNYFHEKNTRKALRFFLPLIGRQSLFDEALFENIVANNIFAIALFFIKFAKFGLKNCDLYDWNIRLKHFSMYKLNIAKLYKSQCLLGTTRLCIIFKHLAMFRR